MYSKIVNFYIKDFIILKKLIIYDKLEETF